LFFIYYQQSFNKVLSISFKKITALILCITFISGSALVFGNSILQNKASEYTQTVDKSDASENTNSEEMQDKKIDYLISQSLSYFKIIQYKYELYSAKNSICFLSYPPFSPPKA
jgi:hypothetical protein